VERAPKNLVVDASVAAKWFIPEADSDKAVMLRNRHVEGVLALMAPDLFVYEVANALVYHPELSVEEMIEDIKALCMIGVELVPPSSELVSSIAEKARLAAVSVYDSRIRQSAGGWIRTLPTLEISPNDLPLFSKWLSVM